MSIVFNPKIEIEPKHIYVFLALLVVLAGTYTVSGYGSSNPSNFGHSGGEVDVNVGGSEMVLQSAIDNELQKVLDKECPDGTVLEDLDGDGTVSCSAELQKRVDQGCSGNKAITAIDSDGGVTCEDVGSSGDITGVYSGFGLQGGGDSGDVTLSIDSSQTQRRVSSCSGDKVIQKIRQDGTVKCVSAGSVKTKAVCAENKNFDISTFDSPKEQCSNFCNNGAVGGSGVLGGTDVTCTATSDTGSCSEDNSVYYDDFNNKHWTQIICCTCDA